MSGLSSLQNRLVKELRLQDISAKKAGNAFAPTFMASYNGMFARPPHNPHDAHRALRDEEDLSHVFTWQEDRKLSRNLAVHFKRTKYLVEPTKEARFPGRVRQRSSRSRPR